MRATTEQQLIIDAVLATDINNSPINETLAVDSCAGSGKTTLLIEIINQLDPKNGLYLAYNKSVALEAKQKFNKKIQCSTSHSFAFQNTIKSYGLHLGSFYWKSMTERITYEEKLLVLDIMKEWCLSKFDKFELFENEKRRYQTNIRNNIFEIVKKYFNSMVRGEIGITHDAYLKFYHMLLAHDKIKHKEFDILMIDEAGDLNPVTFEIFKLIPAKRKIMVGDARQNIYGFNHTINCFDEIDDNVLSLSMTQSFRCHIDIAKKIEAFGHKYIDKNADFKGIEYDDLTPKNSAYISRNNAQLISKMIDFERENIKYNLLRPVDVIFELVLILLSVNNEKVRITKGEYKYIQSDIDEYSHSPRLKILYESAYKYINSIYGEDPGFKTAFTLIREYGQQVIYATHKAAKSHEKEKTKHAITIGTGFGTKGSEFDKVTIMDDLNRTLADIFSEKDKIEDYTDDDKTNIKLYYVVCSRAKKVLINAIHLPEPEADLVI